MYPHQSLPASADPYDEASYEAYRREDYAQTRLSNAALEFIETTDEQPFFLYLAYASPHAALQVPNEELASYSTFDETPYTAIRNYLPHPKPRAARAAMISNIDRSVGAIMDRLEELGISDNTLIIFSSDNGPTPEGGGDVEFFDSNSIYRGYKRDLYEGGIRMPTLARWPGRIQPGSRSDHVSAFWDLMPTLAELAGTEPPKNDGLSFLPALLQEEGQEQHQSLYWEFHNTRGGHTQAVRFLDDFSKSWKAVRLYSENSGTEAAFELYDLDNDPGESVDLAAKNATLVERATEIMKSSRSRSFIDAWNFD